MTTGVGQADDDADKADQAGDDHDEIDDRVTVVFARRDSLRVGCIEYGDECPHGRDDEDGSDIPSNEHRQLPRAEKCERNGSCNAQRGCDQQTLSLIEPYTDNSVGKRVLPGDHRRPWVLTSAA